jgi:hypothetical protein
MCLLNKAHPCPANIDDPTANGVYYDDASGKVWAPYSCMTTTRYSNVSIGYFDKAAGNPAYTSPTVSVSVTNPSTCFPMRTFITRYSQMCWAYSGTAYNGAYVELLSSSDGVAYNQIAAQHPFHDGPWLESPTFSLANLNDDGAIAPGAVSQRSMRILIRDNPQVLDISGSLFMSMTGHVIQTC